MTVITFEPTKPSVTLSESARTFLSQKIEHKQAGGLCFSVKKSGCNGFRYVLDFIDKPSTDSDLVVINDDKLKLYITQEALPYVNGTQIDCVTEGLNKVIKFINPNSSTECGCGESFGIE
jgi:iron-sulfur cluster assembly accessory protein